MGAMKQQMLEDAEHDSVIQELRVKLYEYDKPGLTQFVVMRSAPSSA
jgi:hypothetical protein